MKHRAWTRIELILVVAAIALAYVMIVPDNPPSRYFVKSRFRIYELDDGCQQYKQDNEHYPGQMKPDEIGSDAGKLTGSQILARAMFTKVASDGEIVKGVSNYAHYRDSVLIDADKREEVLSDEYPSNELPVCYYLARKDVDGVLQFIEADNSAHTDPHKGGDFQAFVRSFERPRQDANCQEDRFLLISAGPDRMYFTEDDITNWPRPKSMGQIVMQLITPGSVGVLVVVITLLVYVVCKKRLTSRMV